jgi:TRAP-type transport system periplasmic protein
MKRFFSMVFAAIIFLCSLSITSSVCLAADKVVTLRYSNFFPPASAISVISEEWCKEVEKRTDGRVKVQYFPGATLTKPAQTYDAVKLGLADIGLSFLSYTIGRFPLSEVLDLPLGFKDAYHATKMSNAYYEKFKPKELEDVKMIYLHTVPPHNFFAKKPVRSLEDLKGMKIRSTGTTAPLVTALGGVPVSMPMSESYDALAKGVAEGITSPYEALKGFRLVDVVDYAVPFDAAWSNTAFVVMNQSKWDSLSPDLQEIIEGINRDWIEKQGRLWDELDQEGKDLLLQKKGEIIKLSQEENARWTEKLRPILDDYVQRMKDKGLPGQEALDFCQEYLKAQ